APENAALANHAAQAACREGAATEPEQKDLVARLVVRDEETVGLMDVLFESPTEGAARHSIQAIARADPLVVVHELWDIPVPLGDPKRDLHDVGRARDVVFLLVGPIPRSVAANDESFHAPPRRAGIDRGATVRHAALA